MNRQLDLVTVFISEVELSHYFTHKFVLQNKKARTNLINRNLNTDKFSVGFTAIDFRARLRFSGAARETLLFQRLLVTDPCCVGVSH
jgi:hypothetical protein